MEASTAPGIVILHPNRDKPEAKATKAAVVLLLLVSAGLIAVVTIGGWSVLQGAQPGAIGYVLIYLAMAYYISRWSRGLLPVAAALALIFAIIAAIAVPSWFDRDKADFTVSALEPGILGLLTLIIVPVQILLIAFSMRGFQQEWNVEVEVARDEYEGRVGGAPPAYDDEYVGEPAPTQEAPLIDEPPPPAEPPPPDGPQPPRG